MSSNPLVDTLTAELKNKHVQAQIGRFARLFVVAFGIQLGAMGTGDLGRDALISAGVGAAETAYRQLAPTVPWGKVLRVLHRQAPAPAVPPAGPVIPPPAAGATPPTAK